MKDKTWKRKFEVRNHGKPHVDGITLLHYQWETADFYMWRRGSEVRKKYKEPGVFTRFDTWEDAHAYHVARAEAAVTAAKEAVQRRIRDLAEITAQVKPNYRPIEDLIA